MAAHKVVFLDRASLKAKVRKPAQAESYVEHAKTSADEIVAKLKGEYNAARQRLGLPVLAYLRDTQNYIHLAAHGLTLFDVAPSRVEKDLAQWQGICQWLDS